MPEFSPVASNPVQQADGRVPLCGQRDRARTVLSHKISMGGSHMPEAPPACGTTLHTNFPTCRRTHREAAIRRRDFLNSTAAVAGVGALSAPAVFSSAKAQSRQETLLIVSESGPNNIDIHGVGTNVPGYEVSWNCYDRLISHEIKTVNGAPYYDRDKFKLELADDIKIGDMSVPFKLKKNATFHDGTPVT